MNTEYLENKLNEKLKNIGECKVETSNRDPYTLDVTLTFPPFVPAIDDCTGELWYVCTKEGVDLAFQIKEGKYLFRGDEKLLEILFDDYVHKEVCDK